MEAAGRRYIIHPSRTDEVTIWNLSDVHYLNKACAVNRLKRDIAVIRDDPYSFWLSVGDMMEWIAPNERRFDPEIVPDWVPVSAYANLGQYCIDQAKLLFKDIWHKCLGWGIGNHELWWEIRESQQGLNRRMCEDLGVAYLGYSSMFDIVFVRIPGHASYPVLAQKVPRKYTREAFRVHTFHGAGAAQTEGAKKIRLVRTMRNVNADLIFMGHLHSKMTHERVVLAANPMATKIIEGNVQQGCVCGSYLKTYTQGDITYAEVRGYDPTALGMVYIKVKPQGRKVTAGT